MLVCAFASRELIYRAYEHAVQRGTVFTAFMLYAFVLGCWIGGFQTDKLRGSYSLLACRNLALPRKLTPYLF
jgi:hypothetical protein